MKLLEEKFNSISNKGYIKGIVDGPGSIGLTFENELGISKNELEIPDFCDIEIKTKSNSSSSNITLFNATFDGTYLFETKRLVKVYGWPDKKIRSSNVLNSKIDSRKRNVGIKWKMRLKIDYYKKKVFLEIYDKYGNFIENQCFWTFDLLKEKLMRKDKTIALIKAYRKSIDGIIYFKYNSISFYKLLSFDTFLYLLDHGYIKVAIKLGVFRSGKRLGQLHDHGTGFEINERYFNLLYQRVLK